MSTGTLYDQGNRFTHMTGIVTTTITLTPTRLVRININDATSGGFVDIYNGVTTAGELVGSIDAGVNATLGTREFNVALSGGLTVDINSAAGIDITVIYR